MRMMLLGLAASFFATTAHAQFNSPDGDDVFVTLADRLAMSPGSVRAMFKRQGTLSWVTALFPERLPRDSAQIVAGDEATRYVNALLQNGAASSVEFVRRVQLDLPNDIDPDAMLWGRVRDAGQAVDVACAAISPGRIDGTGVHRPHIYGRPQLGKLTDASVDAASDDQLMRQVQRMIKEMRTSDYVCFLK